MPENNKPKPSMHRRTILTFAGGISAALATGLPRSALAATSYPDRPVKIVVPFAPGGAVDIVGRLSAKYLTDEFGQTVIVDNRSGAGGAIGTDVVAKSAPDGYTLLLNTVSSAVMNGLLYTHLPYDPIKDFVAITEIAASATMVVINAQVPATTLAQFVALVKQHPGEYKFGSTGVGSSIHLDGQFVATSLGLDMIHIPYRGEGDAIRDLVAGVTQMEVGVASAFLPFIRSGQLRALCVNDSKRLKLLPDVPTAAEAGAKDFNLPNWYALYGPRGLPDAIVQQIYQAMKKVLALPEMQQKLADLGLDSVGSSPAELNKYWIEQIKFWEPVVKESGVKLTN